MNIHIRTLKHRIPLNLYITDKGELQAIKFPFFDLSELKISHIFHCQLVSVT